MYRYDARMSISEGLEASGLLGERVFRPRAIGQWITEAERSMPAASILAPLVAIRFGRRGLEGALRFGALEIGEVNQWGEWKVEK